MPGIKKRTEKVIVREREKNEIREDTDGSHTTEFLRENFPSPQVAASPKAMPLPGTDHIHLPGYKNYLCVGLG